MQERSGAARSVLHLPISSKEKGRVRFSNIRHGCRPGHIHVRVRRPVGLSDVERLEVVVQVMSNIGARDAAELDGLFASLGSDRMIPYLAAAQNGPSYAHRLYAWNGRLADALRFTSSCWKSPWANAYSRPFVIATRRIGSEGHYHESVTSIIRKSRESSLTRRCAGSCEPVPNCPKDLRWPMPCLPCRPTPPVTYWFSSSQVQVEAGSRRSGQSPATISRLKPGEAPRTSSPCSCPMHRTRSKYKLPLSLKEPPWRYCPPLAT